MTQKGMRLVAMIEAKENGQYEVVNFLPDLKIKHITGKEFEVIEDQNYIKIPYAQGIDDLTVIVGENGVGKTRLVNDIFSLDENKMFIFKNLDEIDPSYKGRHAYYNFHALNESSYGNNEWNLVFKGAKFVGDDDSEWLINKVSFVKLSNSIESTSSWGMGVDLSTTRLLKDDNYEGMLLSDMDKQIKFLLSEFARIENIEGILGFSGKQVGFVFNKIFIYEAFGGNKVENSYLAKIKKYEANFSKIEDRIKFGNYIPVYTKHYM
ncbi:hypothetical protein [Streptococcus ovuberis]|uniref:Uncharacterized protein n=1 Tax=Streptococcus ovuberis TaxID=1936207 RepID=A0A7X6N1X5_9STRE|nr:hypothetical protein [Streptococcus ovuberis]NKZ21448.1 hypothetical protein [Streptococcus ovuberis]